MELPISTTARSIASLSLGFGPVSIPVRLFTATESSASVRFNLLTKDGQRVKQQYVSASNPKKIVPRAEMVKGYEFDTDRFVIFEAEELKSLEEGASHLIESPLDASGAAEFHTEAKFVSRIEIDRDFGHLAGCRSVGAAHLHHA